MNRTVIEINTSDESQVTVEHAPIKPPPPEGPEALPPHIRAVGKHHRLTGSIWWIGYARPAYEEVSHLQGIVIYNQHTHIFLTREEAAEAQALLPTIMPCWGDNIALQRLWGRESML